VSSVSVGVVGLGYWGPNLARNFDLLGETELRWLCDPSDDALSRLTAQFPQAKATVDFDDLLGDESLDAVVIATPVPLHAELAIRALQAGKHVFVEKPLALTVADAEQVCEAADAAGKVLMVGHLLEYHPGVRKLKDVAASGDLGAIRYIYGNRLNLGKVRKDENALWSLGAHDVSVLLHLADEEPDQMHAFGESYMRPPIEDVVFCYLRFPSGLMAHLHLSWLDPHKERRLTIVGSDKMATFDDMELEQKLVIYDKGFDEDYSSYGEYIARSGDVWSPRVSNEEPLRIECRHFAECVSEGKTPISDGRSGLRVVRVLEGLQQSLDGSARAPAV
jgi:predicted dehydrogenase